jgi:uncharacterized membrane protein
VAHGTWLGTPKTSELSKSSPVPLRASGGREGGKDRRKGISETGAAEYEAYSYGGFGYSFQSPFAVPQAHLGGGKTGDFPKSSVGWSTYDACTIIATPVPSGNVAWKGKSTESSTCESPTNG